MGAPTADPDGSSATTDEPRFYGRRHGRRLRRTRGTLVETLLPRLEVELPPGSVPLVPSGMFPRPVSRVWFEVGFGAGEHLIAQARAHPDVGFIGCEPFVNGVATLLAEFDREPVENVRVFVDDARLLLPRLPDGSLDRVFLLFPDPWPKLRHHRRRFIAKPMVRELARLIREGGELRIATDHAEYARWVLAHLCNDASSQAFDWTAHRPVDWRQPPADWVTTRYQRKAEAAGVAPFFLIFRRCARDEPATQPRKDLVRPSGQDI